MSDRIAVICYTLADLRRATECFMDEMELDPPIEVTYQPPVRDATLKTHAATLALAAATEES